MATTLVQHNIPFALADELTPLFQDIFSDSEIAKNFSSRRTKTACMINGAVAPFFLQRLLEHIRGNPFSLAVDGSSESDVEEMNPLTVRLFDVNRGSMCTQFLHMCMSSSSTAQGIFSKMEQAMTTHNIPWTNCVGLSVDNTSVNMGCRNSIKTHVLDKNPATYIMGCPCHIVHNTAGKAADAFKNVMFVLKLLFSDKTPNVFGHMYLIVLNKKQTHFFFLQISKFGEDLVIDIFYWFDKSTKRKADLVEFCSFWDLNYRKIIKHVNTRWLSLERAVGRMLAQFPDLKSYFLSNGIYFFILNYS